MVGEALGAAIGVVICLSIAIGVIKDKSIKNKYLGISVLVFLTAVVLIGGLAAISFLSSIKAPLR